YGAYGDAAADPPVLYGSIDALEVVGVTAASVDGYTVYTFPLEGGYDIGNVVLDSGAGIETGRKVFSVDALSSALDYYYDTAADTVTLVLSTPLSSYTMVELCETEHILTVTGAHPPISVTGLDFMYGAAHGISATDVKGLTVHDCHFSWLGGGYLHTSDTGEQVRFGNGVEIWNSGRDIEVSDCVFDQIFDTAVTNQGSSTFARQTNISYTDNTISKCGMAGFELWLHGRFSKTAGISFSGNTVSDIGSGWHLTQDDREGAGLGHFVTSFGNVGSRSDIDISSNTFTDAFNASGTSSVLLVSDTDTDPGSDTLVQAVREGGNTYSGVDEWGYSTAQGVVSVLDGPV
ncbi:hypothetical protein KIPB_002059, partial [Kipferlia bialata]